ncbi:MAG TPA: hypothetical protein VF053_02815 [Streptosporangiales bacterium]
MTLLAAAVTADVTPPPGHPLGGYLSRHDAVSTGTHDPLTATLVHVCDDAAGPGVLWVALDALGIAAATAEPIRSRIAAAAGVPADTVLVCSSHTHSGPDAWLPRRQSFTSVPPDGQLVTGLVDRLAAAAGELGARRRPVTASWGVAPDVGVGTNRNDPAGPHDDTAGVLTLRAADGETVAVLVDYACHPTVLNHDNLRYSADFPGAARTVAAAGLSALAGPDTRPPAVAFLQGAAGDASPRFTRRGQSFAEAARLGGILGAAAVRGALAGEEVAVLGGVPVLHRAAVELPVRSLPAPEELRARLERTEAAWRQLAGRPGAPETRIARSRYEGAMLLARLHEADLPPTMRLPIAVAAFGDVAWAHVPVELFASLGQAIVKASPYPCTRVVGYTDDYLGYVADAAAHEAQTYEANSSFFDAAAGAALVDAVVALLRRARD